MSGKQPLPTLNTDYQTAAPPANSNGNHFPPDFVLPPVLDQLPDRIRRRTIPLVPNGKRPFTKDDDVPRRGDHTSTLRDGGFRFKGMPGIDDSTILEWMERFPGCTWALRTGFVSDTDNLSLVTVDVDYPERLPDQLYDLFYYSPRFTRIHTPRGIHLYGWSRRTIRSMPTTWGDLKGQGNYVKAYPAETPIQLSLWPDSVLDEIGAKEATPDPHRNAKHPRRRGDQVRPAPSTTNDNTHPYAYDGERNNKTFWPLMKEAGRRPALRGQTDQLVDILTDWNDRCVPPETDQRIQALAERVSLYSANWTEHKPEFIEPRRKGGINSGISRRNSVQERNEALIEAYNAGAPYKQLEAVFGLSERQIRRITKHE